jgi:hypothetical protein
VGFTENEVSEYLEADESPETALILTGELRQCVINDLIAVMEHAANAAEGFNRRPSVNSGPRLRLDEAGRQREYEAVRWFLFRAADQIGITEEELLRNGA